MQWLGPFCALASSVTWAFASSRYALAARHAGGVRVNCARALSACALWGAAALVVHGAHVLDGLTAARMTWLALSIVCSYVLGDGLFFAAAQRAGVSSALAVATTYPLWAALYGVLVRGEALGASRALGLLGCVLGVAALLRLGAPAADTQHARKGVRVGIALAGLTSLFWAGNAVFLKQGAEGVSFVQANALRFAVGALLLTLRVRFTPSEPGSEGQSMLALARELRTPLCLDVILGSVCYVYGLANSDLTLGVTLSSLSPLAALPIAIASGTERITPARAACVCVIVASVILLVQ